MEASRWWLPVSGVPHCRTELRLGRIRQTRTAGSGAPVGCHTRSQNFMPLGVVSAHSAGSAWVRPPARPCERLGRAGRSPTHATIDMWWMVCQYSRRGLVSSEKHETAARALERRRWSHLGRSVTVTVVVGGYWTRPAAPYGQQPYG